MTTARARRLQASSSLQAVPTLATPGHAIARACGTSLSGRLGTVLFMAATVAAMLCGVLISPAAAQTAQPMLTSEEQPVEITLTPAFQWYEEGSQSVQESSLELRGFVPLGRRWQAMGSLEMARAGLGSRDALTGISDVEVGALYMRTLGTGSLVARLDARLPVGTDELTAAELATAAAVSRSVYGFRVAGFGEGASLGPSITWALSLSERVVAGIGGGYTYRGSYKPIAGMEEVYNPGSEVEANVGVDVSLTDETSVAVDLRYRRYGVDRVGAAERLESGDFASGIVQVEHQFDTDRLRVIALHQSWAESEVYPFVVGTLETRDGTRRQLAPSYTALQVSYTMYVWERPLTVRGEGRRYGSTVVEGSHTVALLGIRPSFKISDAGEGIVLSPEAEVMAGSVFGIDAGMRTAWRF